jgi:hypothetical protein
MLRAAAKGRTVVFDRETSGCPGGGTGLGFGDCYVGFPIERLLSTGGEAELASGDTYDMGEGERFFESPEVATRWRRALPYREVPSEFIVCKPLEQVAEGEEIALVLMFVNPDGKLPRSSKRPTPYPTAEALARQSEALRPLEATQANEAYNDALAEELHYVEWQLHVVERGSEL